jgi:hypothetical protein
MADFPYTTVPGKLSEFLKKIRDIGVPDKVTTRWLPTIGFRGHASGHALATAIQDSYAELYKTYPDAHSRGAEELKAFFRGHSSYGAQAVAKAVGTFQALCQNAEFSGSQKSKQASAAPQVRVAEVNGPPPRSTGSTENPSLHIDLQIHISPEATPDQIEKIFESMAKHLYKPK